MTVQLCVDCTNNGILDIDYKIDERLGLLHACRFSTKHFVDFGAA